MDNRIYMQNISKYIDWCYIHNINPNELDTKIINNYLNYVDNKKEVRESLLKYKSYIK
ncbi:hypothetical protein QTH65_13570 [Clostridium perfringens]|nr:hypothetical protein [Clostridium perfringens]